MKFKEAVKVVLKDCNISQTELAKKLGYKANSGIANALVRNNMTVKTLVRLLDEIGYELTFRPKYGQNKAERTIVITNEE